ncbi:hypothetical protein [Alteromonas gracilis]|uniref:hypothetical protein n=1 Tax=Alteromonas gracilis TaxID=1479524 RepID=UPI003734F349
MMSQKIWNVKFVAGNPNIFSKVRTALCGPLKRSEANEAFENVSNHGWRAWIEHAKTGKRIAESPVETAYREH